MSTLAEIEAAVELLPAAEQRVLLSHLEPILNAKLAASGNRDSWLHRLAGLRARSHSKRADIQELMDDLRGTAPR